MRATRSRAGARAIMPHDRTKASTQRLLPLECPYCGHTFEVPGPDGDKLGLAGVAGDPLEIECLPYTRDIGRFDEEDWSEIGEDFFAQALGWERVGILRSVDEAVVVYQAPRCRSCGELFDVYANYSESITLAEMWPHLFRRQEEAAPTDDIQPYTGETLTGRVLGRLAKVLLGDNLAASLLVGLLAYVLSWLPLWFQLWNGGTWDWKQVLKDHGSELLLRTGGALCLALLLYQFCRYLRFLREEKGFSHLLQVREPRGVTYWRNFSLSRFVGVQQKGEKFSMTQVAVVAGIPSVVLLCGAWIVQIFGSARAALQSGQAAPWLSGESLLLFLLGSLFVAFILGSLGDDLFRVRRRSGTKNEKSVGEGTAFFRRLISRLIRVVLPLRMGGLVAVLVVLLGWLVYLLVLASSGLGGTATLGQVFAFLFWGLVVYYVGVAVWLSFNTSLYLLKGLSKVPMNLSPLDRFSGSEIVERIADVSSTTNLVVFLFAVLLVSVGAMAQASLIPASLSAEWLLDWGRWGLIVLYGALAIGTAGNFASSFLVGLAYLLASLALRGSPPLPLGQVTLSYNTMLFGLFMSYLLYFHYRSCHVPIDAIKRKYKQRWLKKYEEETARVQGELDKMGPLACSSVPSAKDRVMLLQRYLLHEELENLISIREKIAAVPVSISTRYTAVAKILGPFVSSIVLPVIIDYAQKLLEGVLKLKT